MWNCVLDTVAISLIAVGSYLALTTHADAETRRSQDARRVAQSDPDVTNCLPFNSSIVSACGLNGEDFPCGAGNCPTLHRSTAVCQVVSVYTTTLGGQVRNLIAARDCGLAGSKTTLRFCDMSGAGCPCFAGSWIANIDCTERLGPSIGLLCQSR